jgi:GTPase SAR1 family protein
MDSINIAVIGADGVGKSAFIQRALRLPRPPSLNVTSLRQDVDGAPHVVTLIELDLEDFDVNPDQPIQWPKQIGGHMVPRVDGALILYDVMNKESVRDLPPTMCESGPAHALLIAGHDVCPWPSVARGTASKEDTVLNQKSSG